MEGKEDLVGKCWGR